MTEVFDLALAKVAFSELKVKGTVSQASEHRLEVIGVENRVRAIH